MWKSTVCSKLKIKYWIGYPQPFWKAIFQILKNFCRISDDDKLFVTDAANSLRDSTTSLKQKQSTATENKKLVGGDVGNFL